MLQRGKGGKGQCGVPLSLRTLPWVAPLPLLRLLPQPQHQHQPQPLPLLALVARPTRLLHAPPARTPCRSRDSLVTSAPLSAPPPSHAQLCLLASLARASASSRLPAPPVLPTAPSSATLAPTASA